MQIHPTRSSLDLAIAGVATVAAGIVAEHAVVVAWGGALLVGLALARAVTYVGVARIRSAGFEMLWQGEQRLVRMARGETVELLAEIRNRDSRAARYVALRPVCSPLLNLHIEPAAGEVPAAGRLAVRVRVHAPRVGRHGIHGLSLEVQGSPGLFEVPLTFANPFGIEVLPNEYATHARSARGGRSRLGAQGGRAGPFAGDGSELRELREHQPGDPFKRIAWKASARRGKLMVREYEREERDIVWLLLDASVEHWAGVPGHAALDIAIDELAAVAARHTARGDRVGLGILAARTLAWMPPDRRFDHLTHLMSLLATHTACIDADRSDLDETDAGVRVLEHMRPLAPQQLTRLRSNDLDRLVRRADRVRARAPFSVVDPYATSHRERRLRRYMAQFGMFAPPRVEPERALTDANIAQALMRILKERPRASIVYLWSPPPTRAGRPEIERVLESYPRRHVDLRWVSMRPESGIAKDGTELAPAVEHAMSLRARIARERGELVLRSLGIRVHRISPSRRRAMVELPPPDAPLPSEPTASRAGLSQ